MLYYNYSTDFNMEPVHFEQILCVVCHVRRRMSSVANSLLQTTHKIHKCLGDPLLDVFKSLQSTTYSDHQSEDLKGKMHICLQFKNQILGLHKSCQIMSPW